MSNRSSTSSVGLPSPPRTPPEKVPTPYAIGISLLATRHTPPEPFGNFYSQVQEPDEDELDSASQEDWCLSHPPLQGITHRGDTRYLTIVDALRAGNQRGAQILLADNGLVVKIFDPLFYEFHDSRFPEFKKDVTTLADRDYATEANAYQVLSGTPLEGNVTPAYYGSWTIDVPITVNGEETTREVRMILLEYVHGTSMYDMDPDELTNRARENIMFKFIEAATDLKAAGVHHGDLFPRNVLLSHPSNDYSSPDMRLCLIDFNCAIISKFAFPNRRKDIKYNPAKDWWSPSMWISWGWLPEEEETREWVWMMWGDGREGKYAKVVRDLDDLSATPTFPGEEDSWLAQLKKRKGVKRTVDGQEKFGASPTGEINMWDDVEQLSELKGEEDESGHGRNTKAVDGGLRCEVSELKLEGAVEKSREPGDMCNDSRDAEEGKR